MFALALSLLLAASPLQLHGPIQSPLQTQLLAAEIREAGPVTLHIDSPGGSVGLGLKLVEAIEANGQVTCIARNAYSMAAVIFQACKVRLIEPLGILMLHPVSIGGLDETVTADNLEELAGRMRAMTDALLTYSCRRTRFPGVCWARSQKTFWVGPQLALAVGLADGILK